MNTINICTIKLSEGEGRQGITYNPDDGKLYSTAWEEPIECAYETIDDAVKATRAMWGAACWGLEWARYKVKAEYYDLWGAWDGEDQTNMDEIERLAAEWETTIQQLIEQVESID